MNITATYELNMSCMWLFVLYAAMQWCKKNGIKPNEDIFFVSFANLPITDYLDHPPAASLEQYAYLMGEKAAKLMISLLEDESVRYENNYQEIIMDTELVVHI